MAEMALLLIGIIQRTVKRAALWAAQVLYSPQSRLVAAFMRDEGIAWLIHLLQKKWIVRPLMSCKVS